MPAIWTQSFPPAPAFTEKNIGSQLGKVFIVTGGATGIGFQLSTILYRAHSTVYIATRSKDKATKAIEQIKSHNSGSNGRLEFLYLDLADLTTVKPAVENFQSRESKIDVLFNNAGIGADVGDIRSAQGNEIHYATNCVGPLLFTRLLQKQLEAADGTARVIWTASMTVDFDAPPGGIDMTKLENHNENGPKTYASSKAGNWLICSELAKEQAANGQPKVVHLVINPGNLKTPIWRYVNWFFVQLLNWTMLYDAKLGACTALWAGLSPDIMPEDAGRYIIPFGRWHPQPREDILDSLKGKGEGGTGIANRFVEWCEGKYSGFD